ncbi:hypothetical protein JKP75_15880 [Blastococcus sp. TML/M2B]|uniref:cell division protein PerM n=1 Tax=unclassified Blastococcus TaxID=2619396 RepID=UPI00190B27BF|nr:MULTISPECIES: DUF6350 family protein [unclassified Blastococcus]MBN1093902.1 hypothetical protein [Blastococcus sp. TML/M2B]MBN1095980.1 hypothetical protein [Blastococcus sp. TML/C7B]
MVPLLARLPRRGPDGGRTTGPLPTTALALAGAAAASVVGLGVLWLAVGVVDTLDPTGGQGAGGSLVLAGLLWLLAQGAGITVASGPIVLAPLLLTLGIAWCLSAAGRVVVRLGDLTGPRETAAAVGVLAAAHVVLTAVLALLLDGPGAEVGLLRALLGSALLAVAAAGWGAARESGAVDTALDQLPGQTRPLLRGVLAGVLTALALCLAVVAIAVAADADGYAAVSGGIGGAGAGALGLLGLCVLLLPNAAAAVLGLAAGPGFAVGSGTVVSVHGVTLGAVPALPLLAALPDTQAVPLLAFASQAVPVLAGLVAGRTLARRLLPGDGGAVVAGLAGVLAGVLTGVACGLLVWTAGGSLGDGALADVGAPPIATGVAIAAQAGIAAAVAAAFSRWRLAS